MFFSDHVAQNSNVHKTLSKLQISPKLRNSMITVGNKIDLISSEDLKYIREDGMIPISTKSGQNMEELIELIDDILIQSTNRVKATFKVLTGSDEFRTIMKRFAISDVQVCDEDYNYTLIQTIGFYHEAEFFKEFLVKNLD